MRFAKKYISRKFLLVLVALWVIYALAGRGKLDAVAAGAIVAVLAFYNRANLQQRQADLATTEPAKVIP